MKDARKTTQQKIEWILIFFAPLVFAAYGIFRWQRRKSARLHVSLA